MRGNGGPCFYQDLRDFTPCPDGSALMAETHPPFPRPLANDSHGINPKLLSAGLAVSVASVFHSVIVQRFGSLPVVTFMLVNLRTFLNDESGVSRFGPFVKQSFLQLPPLSLDHMAAFHFTRPPRSLTLANAVPAGTPFALACNPNIPHLKVGSQVYP